jgi:hypothetical protein
MPSLCQFLWNSLKQIYCIESLHLLGRAVTPLCLGALYKEQCVMVFWDVMANGFIPNLGKGFLILYSEVGGSGFI